MKKFSIMGGIILLLALFVSCNSDELNSLIHNSEESSDKIAAIDQQVVKINESLAQLQKADKDLGELMASLKEEDSAIKKSLESTKKALEDKIAELKAYVDDELKNTKNWVSATFATLEQYQSLCDEVATLKEGLSALDSSLTSKINSSISSLESSMKTWVNGQLANYYTIAEMNAKLEALQKSVTDGDTANAEEIEKLAQTLKTEVENLTAAYKKAIVEAITENNGIIDGKIQSEIADVNTRIDNEVKTLGDKIAAIEKRIKEIEGRINTIDEQIASINATLKKLQELEDAISALKAEDETIKGLIEEAKKALEDKIAELKTYVGNELNKTKNWASASFATLTQYQSLCDEVASLKSILEALDIDSITEALNSLEESMKTWVNGQLANYYTIAEINAKLEALQDAITNGDSANAEEIATLKQNLETAKSELTTAYQTAIEEAINQNNGVINQKIADDIKAATDALQETLNGLSARIDAIENRVAALEDKVAKIISGVQSVVVVPDYSDGSVRLSNIADNKIRFEVYPLEAAEAIAETGPSILSLDYVETITKSSEDFVNLPVTAVTFTGKTLILTVDGTNIPETIISGTSSANARLRISDGTNTRSSEYFPISAGLALPTTLQAVDLGLSVKWANMNVGASAPEEYGDYFAWGETQPKDNYGWSTYNWCDGDAHSLIKYCDNASFGQNGFTDALNELESSDDAATAILGGKWRMPTDAEWTEFRTRCTFSWDSINGVVGQRCVGPNGNSIFLPAAGRMVGDGLIWVPTYGFYWSSSYSNPECAWRVGVYSEDIDRRNDVYRCEGLSIRPVYGDSSPGIEPGGEPSGIIAFADENVKNKLVRKFDTDGDGELSYAEAASVTSGDDLKTAFGAVKTYKSFNEFQYFTGITTIPDQMFDGWTGLQSIIIPSNVKSIGYQAFHGCSNLTSIIIPDSVTYIGREAFKCCSGIQYIILPNKATQYDEFAFEQCNSLTSISIPSGTQALSEGMFYCCANLVSIEIPQSVTFIGNRAFYNCTKLNQIILPISVSTIDSRAFSGCMSVTELTIPESVKVINESAFENCSSLTRITILATTPPNGSSNMFNNTNNCPIYVPADSLEDYQDGFYWIDYADRYQAIPEEPGPGPDPEEGDPTGDGSLDNPFNVAAARSVVKDLTWTSNTDYQKVGPYYVKGKISKIANKGTYAESGEYGNATFDIVDEGFEASFAAYRILYLGNQKYTSGTDIKVGDEVIIHAELMNYRGNIPETVSNGGYLYSLNGETGGEPGPEPGGIIAFADENVKKKLVRKFDTDGDGELSYAEAASVTSGDDLKTAFGGVKTYQSFDEFQYFTGITTIPNEMFAGWELTSIKLPDSITSLGERVFAGCTKLTTITLPSKLNSIGRKAFYEWTGLKSIIIPSNIKSIGSDAFRGCTALSSITIPNNVTSLDGSVFEDCTGLTSVIIEGGITAIDLFTFYNCSTLSSITLPNSITSIGHRGFEGCSSLTSIDIPKNVSLIDDYAFANSGLTSLTIPKNVTSIGGDAFCNCSNLTKITILPTNPPSGANGMFSNTNNCPIYVPAESLEDYQDGFYWIDYADRYQPIPE